MLNTLALVGLPLIAAGGLLLASARRVMGGRTSWIILAAAMVFAAIAGALLSAQPYASGSPLHPTLPIQLTRLATVTLVVIGVLLSPIAGVSRLSRSRLPLEAGVTATATFCLLWAAGIKPQPGQTSAALAIIYPAVDAVVLTLLLQGLSGARTNRLALALWSGGLALILMANTGVAAAMTSSGSLAGWVYWAWTLGFGCLSVGAVSADGQPVSEGTDSTTRLLLPYAAALAGGLAGYVRILTAEHVDGVLLTAVFLLVLLILARQWALSQENLALLLEGQLMQTSQLEQAAKTAELEGNSLAIQRFWAEISHEFRTSLNAILGFAQLALNLGSELDPRTRRYLEHIQAGGRHMLHLANDVLDHSKLLAGRVDVELIRLNAVQQAEDAVAQVAAIAAQKNIRLTSSATSHDLVVLADERRLRQVLLNVLSNAIKFTPPGGEVRVDVARSGGSAVISVKDTGIGIAQPDQERIFREYVQVPVGDTSGTGLGLTLSRQLMELMNGSLTVQSALGKGSTFTMTLPAVGRVPTRGDFFGGSLDVAGRVDRC